jgi:2-polyprenyl-3-methyl-5-hydroxy-6-metoxy-1,4-benzoquinol methylase
MTQTTATCALGRQKCEPRNLAEVIHCVARHSGVDTHRLADLLETDYPTFVRWTEPNGQSQIPARKLAALAQHTGRFDHLAWIASDAGLTVAPLAPVAGANRVKELLDICESFGQLAATDRDADVNGIDAQERAQLLDRLRAMKKEVAEYEQALVGLKTA